MGQCVDYISFEKLKMTENHRNVLKICSYFQIGNKLLKSRKSWEDLKNKILVVDIISCSSLKNQMITYKVKSDT